MITMRERWVFFMRARGFVGHVLSQDAVKAAIPFAESEVRIAMGPRDPAPGLAEAEDQLRKGDPSEEECDVVSAEIDRLRAIEKQQRELLSTLVYWHDHGNGHIDKSWWNEARKLGGEP